MPTAFDPLTGQDVDTDSETWRHSCECRYLLRAFPTRNQKHLHLYGVIDRSMLFEVNAKTGETAMREDYKKLWPKSATGRTINPLMHWRGIEEADRILADAKRLYELTQPK
jgi:hypothetical protein